MSILSQEGKTSLYDYFAASMITIATIWLWSQIANHIPQFLETTPPKIVTAVSYGFYTVGGAAASYLVLYKTGNRQVKTGLKVGAFCSVASALYYTLYSGVQPNLILAIIISFLLGGYLGAILMIRLATRRADAPQADVEAELKEEDTNSS